MPTPTTLSTSKVTSNDAKGRKATDLFRAAYDKAGLSEARAQQLNENRKFSALLLQLIEEESADQVIRETKILKPEAPITFTERTTPIYPQEFFNRLGIYTSDFFWEHILPALQPVVSTPKRTYGIGCLKNNIHSDREIRSSLPKRHLGNWEDIASLIEMYPNGKEGSYYHLYILYMKGVNGKVFGVSVSWFSDDREWSIDGWRLDEDGHRRTDYQVLCPSDEVL